MAKLARVISIEGQYVTVPEFVNRTVCGWQVRVRGVPSQHFADDQYGGVAHSLAAAAAAVPGMKKDRDAALEARC